MATTENDTLIPGVDYEVAVCCLCGKEETHSHSWEEYGFNDNESEDN